MTDSIIRDIGNADCKNVLLKIPYDVISLAGLEKSIEKYMFDFALRDKCVVCKYIFTHCTQYIPR